MKKIILLLFLCFAKLSIAQSETVALDSIANYVGKTVTICETITGTYQTKTEHKVTYLNFGKPFPNHSLSLVIFKKDLENFSYDPMSLKGKTVCITGEVVLYKDKPQIVVHKEEEIVLK